MTSSSQVRVSLKLWLITSDMDVEDKEVRVEAGGYEERDGKRYTKWRNVRVDSTRNAIKCTQTTLMRQSVN